MGNSNTTLAALYGKRASSKLSRAIQPVLEAMEARVFLSVAPTPTQVELTQGLSGLVQPQTLDALANDESAGAISLTFGQSSSQDNSGATANVDETIAGQTAQHSLWYKWTASQTGDVAVTLAGSSVTGLMAVYTDNGDGTLNSVGDNQRVKHELYYYETPQVSYDQRISFHAVAGTTYYAAVDGVNGQTGTLQVEVDGNLPVNDNFANATALETGVTLPGQVTTGATTELGDPADVYSYNNGSGQYGPNQTVWYTWTAQSDGAVVMNVTGTGIIGVGAFTGGSVDSLSPVARSAGVGATQIEWTASTGTTYHIAVDGNSSSFDISLAVQPPPVNDNLADAQNLPINGGTVSGDTRYATAEPGEPDITGEVPSHSIWYKWQAGSDGKVVLNLLNAQSYSQRMAVYTQDAKSVLQVVADDVRVGNDLNYNTTYRWHSGTAVINAVAGETYYVAVDTASGGGPIQLQLQVGGVPANDDFANATVVTGDSVILTGNTTGATPEDGEPIFSDSYPRHTIWWSWVAPSSRTMAASMLGGRFGVLSGDSMDSLTKVTSGWSDGQVSAFEAVAGTRYFFVADVFTGYTGSSVTVNLAPALPPVNDNFADATALPTAGGSVSGTMQFATAEPGEPGNGGDAAVNSIWYKWQATTDGKVVLSLSNTGSARLAIFTKNADGTLQSVADDVREGRDLYYHTSYHWHSGTAVFDAVAGQTYYVAVDSTSATSIQLKLQLGGTPANDDFANATEVTGDSAVLLGTTDGATPENGEPRITYELPHHTIWWSWVAPSSATMSITNLGGYHTVNYAVLTGDALGSLVAVTGNVLGTLSFDAIAGTRYYIVADADQSAVVMTLGKEGTVVTPSNDSFADAPMLPSDTTLITGNNVGATSEIGEPNHGVASWGGAGNSVWWNWIAPTTGVFKFNASASSFTPVVAIYTGSDLADLTRVAGPGWTEITYLHATAGTTYHLAADAMAVGDATQGLISISLTSIAIPVNDDFANAGSLPTGTSVHGTTEGAGAQTGEPVHGGKPANGSTWWTWTAPATGVFDFHLDAGETFNKPSVDVYLGEALDALTRVGGSPVDGGNNSGGGDFWQSGGGEFWLETTAGTTYRIAVDGSQFTPFAYDMSVQRETAVAGPVSGFYMSPVAGGLSPNSGSESKAATTYELWRSDDNYLSHATRVAIVQPDGEYVDTTAVVGKVYRYWARAVNSNGAGPFSLGADGLMPGQIAGSDSLAGATVLPGWWTVFNGSNTGGTAEAGESLAPNDAGKTVWYKWTSPWTGPAWSYVGTSDFRSVVTVHTSTNPNPSVADLSLVVQESMYSPQFNVTAGTTYWIAIDGSTAPRWEGDPQTGDSGQFKFVLNNDPSSGGGDPASESFAGVFPGVSGPSVTLDGSLYNATKEVGEPGDAAMTQSVWWAWTATESGPVHVMNGYGSYFSFSGNPFVSVYTSDSLASLTPVASNFINGTPTDSLDFTATAGTTYRLQFGSNPSSNSNWFTWGLEQDVEINRAPTDLSLNNSSVAEHQVIGTMVGAFTATDPDTGNTFTYVLVAGAGDSDNGSFTIDADGNLRTGAEFNFESTKTSYSIRVRTTDQGSLSVEKTFIINVTNINETPTDLSLNNSSVAEHQVIGAKVGAFTATDPDTGNTFTYVLAAGAGDSDNGSFTIDADGNLRTGAEFNFESAKTSYSIRVRTTDQGSLSLEKTFIINVTNINETPTDLSLNNSSVAEHQMIGTKVGAFTATDPDTGNTFTYVLVAGAGDSDNGSFTIDADGNLRTGAEFNFESGKTSYSVRVRTTDQGSLSVEKTLGINVTNINEAPTDLEVFPASVLRNWPAGTLVATLSATDPDAGDAAGITYTLVAGEGSTSNTMFKIEGNQLKTVALIPSTAPGSYSIRIQATDSGGLTHDKVVTISVAGSNVVPTDITLSRARVAENQDPGAFVGTLGAVDGNAGDSFTYSLVGGAAVPDNAFFTIDGTTLKTHASFDYEMQKTYSIRVMVADKGGLKFRKDMTVKVINVNEKPTSLGISSKRIAENMPAGTVVGSFSSVDPDIANTFTYTLADGGVDNAAFKISANGRLKTKKAFDYESKSRYSILVRSMDQGGLFCEQAITVKVTDVNEAPTGVAMTNSSVLEHKPAGTLVGKLIGTDPDAGNTLTYALISGAGDNAMFYILNGKLRTASVLDDASKSVYKVRVRVTDQGGLWFDQAMRIGVTR